jgi:hypothetical protein
MSKRKLNTEQIIGVLKQLDAGRARPTQATQIGPKRDCDSRQRRVPDFVV